MMEQYFRGLGGVIFLRKFDLFSQPFYHRVDYNQKTKKTAFGGFLSMIIVLLSLAYLIYILYLFFSDSYTPSITSIQTTQTGLTTYTINFSPFAFTFRLKGAIYDKWQNYFSVLMYLDNDGNSPTADPFQVKQCKDVLPQFVNLQDHFCIDTQTTPAITLKTNQNDPSQDILFNFALFIKKGCSAGSSCDPATLLGDPQFIIEFAFVYERYDADTKSTLQILQRENIVLDKDLYFQEIYQVQLTKAYIDDGFLLSSWTDKEYISDFRKSSSTMTSANKLIRLSNYPNVSDLVRITQIQLTDSLVEMTIQYPKISIVLAQFQSIFSTLLIVGIVAKIGSENRNVEENIDIIMNNYYKKSALEIDEYIEKNKQQKPGNHNSTKNLQQIEPVKDMTEIVKDKAKIKNRLFNLYSIKLLKHYYSDGKKIKDDEIDPQIKGFKKALTKSWSLMNAHQMHLEILRSKTALQMLLSEKQYASLDFVSRSLYPKEGEANHLELLDQIDEDQDLKVKKAIEYYQELMKKDNISDPTDQNFKSAIIKQIFENKHPCNEEELQILHEERTEHKDLASFNAKASE